MAKKKNQEIKLTAEPEVMESMGKEAVTETGNKASEAPVKDEADNPFMDPQGQEELPPFLEGNPASPVKTETEIGAGSTEASNEYLKIEEVTLKFGKGCVGEEFTGKDGVNYRQVSIPNQDRDDHRPWQTFVVRANRIHDNKFGKGVWVKLPRDGSTTISRRVSTGIDDQGNKIWQTEKTKVPNTELKKMVEFYKERDKGSFKERLEEKKAEASLLSSKDKPRQRVNENVI